MAWPCWKGSYLKKTKPFKRPPDGVQILKQKKTEGYKEPKRDHPIIAKEEMLKRKIKIPQNIEGKWKAVKLLIKHKGDKEATRFKVVNLRSSFALGEGFRITVGPFFPNFVMNELYYTSMNNQLLNPAVRL